MADIERTKEEPIMQFFDMTDEVAAGMLGIDGSGQFMQPMHPHIDRETRSIWFFAKKDSDLVGAIKPGSRAHLCVIGKDHDYHACVEGTVRVDADRAIVDRYWDSITAAWFDDKEDPNLTMVEMRLDKGVAWASTNNSVKFGWEIMKANMGEGEPDVGARKHFTFTV